jgi:hypothetical protein
MLYTGRALFSIYVVLLCRGEYPQVSSDKMDDQSLAADGDLNPGLPL